MSSRRRPPLFFLPLLFWAVLQAGCAARLPSSLPIVEDQRDTLLATYSTFSSKNCAAPIDADISLDLYSFGKHLKTRGYLQLQPPERLRATIIDTMGRPLLILIGSGDSFTLVNSARGEALIGTVYGLTRETDRPVDLQAGDVVSLLTGRFFPPPALLKDMRKDKENTTLVWLYFSPDGDIRHNILFDPEAGRIMRDILNDGEGNILLDVRYIRENEGAGECSLPEGLVISGDALGGEVALNYDLVLRPQAIPDNTFELELPEHFVIKRMD